MTNQTTLKFANTQRDFANTLNLRVNQYFKNNKISKYGNMEMYTKTLFMFTLYFTPYTLMLTQVVTNPIGMLALVFVMGLGLAGIGLSVMHDANHGAYSSKNWVNKLFGYSLNLVGANSFNWRVQHNVLHHTYTNVHDHDEDISPRGVLRLCPSTPAKGIHKFQHIYAWFLYSLMTIVWLFFKDFVRIIRYNDADLIKSQKTNIVKEWIILLGTKAFYISYIFVLPLQVTSLVWWQVALGIVMMHLVAGFILAIIFQPAHVAEGTEFPVADDKNVLANNWAVHQLLTTANFGNKNKLLSWYAGGLNFQVEHHLFPNVCHVHYSKISAIVKKTASEFGVPYKSFKTFRQALVAHGRLLYQLGSESREKKSGFSTLANPFNQVTYMQGIVKFFNEAKGFGFIKLNGSNEDIFVHSSGLIDRIRQNDKVEFEQENGKKGLTAVRVRTIA